MSKISLDGIASKMSVNQMKSVTGGSGGSGRMFSCRCFEGANAPFNSSWTAFYGSHTAAINDIRRICRNGTGECN